MTNLSVILGNQLFEPSLIPQIVKHPVFMCESDDLCAHYQYHKLKIAFFLTAMRDYADELKINSIQCYYHHLKKEKKQIFCDVLSEFCNKNKVKTLHITEIEDHFFEQKIKHLCKAQSINLKVHKSPMFLNSREDFEDYLRQTKKPFMKTFYQIQRKKLNILMIQNKPKGGKFSFDEENRKKTPKDLHFPDLPKYTESKHKNKVQEIIKIKFNTHPGSLENTWLPTSRKQAKHYLLDFVKHRFESFGQFEDAIDYRSDIMFHSALSSLINCGLLTPNEILKKLKNFEETIPINSFEGFIRQIIGWREFIRGIYHHFNEEQQESNFFNHQNKLNPLWYTGETNIVPLDDAIKQVMRTGHTHHINRLMVIGNIMLLTKVHPQEVYRWFMECFIDSSDWVMGPNVFGMSQFSDGGIFATKPYICSSNYILKMSHYKKGPWCELLDALYWRFILDNQTFLNKNFRMRMMVSRLNSFSEQKKDIIKQISDKVIQKLTH